ncbi:MAG: Oxidoreductase [Pedobacter sp.]|jgi:scyllo-inositol 2-dehydrogenase (NADP+)|nr:Oxidoreductase [Pedobacter sp.]
MDQIIKTGLLAYGMSGKVFHAPFLSAHPGFELSAITERHVKKAQVDYPGIKSYDSVEALIDDASIELVVINTPNFTHYEYARKALLKGKHILVEKPFAPTVEEAKELFELAERLGRKVFVYQNRRWDSDFLAVRKIVTENTVGKINELHIRYDRYRAGIGVKSFKEELVPATGLQYDLGPHLLDQAISLFGKPLTFYKVLAKNRTATKVDDYFNIHLGFENDINVYLSANMLVVDPQAAFVIHGEIGSFVKQRSDVQEEQLLKGMKLTEPGYGLESEQKAGILTLVAEDGSKAQTRVASGVGSYLPLFDAVYQSIVLDEPFPVTPEHVLMQLAILQAEAGAGRL